MADEGTPDPIAANMPWYRATTETHPFTLSKIFSVNDADAPAFHCTAAFPWNSDSMSTLWEGAVTDTQVLSDWREMVLTYASSVAVGTTGRLYVFPKITAVNLKPLSLRLYDVSWDVQCVAWALRPESPTDPLIIFAASSVIFVLDVKTQKIIGHLRGHGGPITSIAVHPHHPYLFGTTARDFTTRIYDLTLTPTQKPNNPHWPPKKTPSLAGAAHGLHMSESEGKGIGRCVAVLVGGRSGGHKGAVLSATFHPSAPLIATCGMDRAVKIWRIPPYKPEVISREDKPLFSTDYIHKARVLSIAWLSGDILVSHSAPALMRGDRRWELYEEDGAVVMWQWLGYDRYFPPDKPPQKVMRGCASDYRNSESFKVLSAYHLPPAALNVTVFTSTNHDPLILIPKGKVVRVINLTHFGPREPPQFPFEDELNALTKRMRLDDDADERAGEVTAGVDNNNVHNEAGDAETEARGTSAGQGARDADGQIQDDDEFYEDEYAPRPLYRLAHLLDAVKGWAIDLSIVDEAKRVKLPDITACEMAFGGRYILGTGANGTLYVWRLAKLTTNATSISD